MEEIKLNIGSNTVRFEGFKNVDIRDIPEVDIVDEVSELKKIKDNSVSYIKAHAILEHFAPDMTSKILKNWVSKLKSGGEIEISVPDGELIFDRYLNIEPYKGNWGHLVHSIFGSMEHLREWHGKDAELYMHHTLFSQDYLRQYMEKAGLTEIIEVPSPHQDCVNLKGTKV